MKPGAQGSPATAKNVLTVGASHNAEEFYEAASEPEKLSGFRHEEHLAYFSSWYPHPQIESGHSQSYSLRQ